MTLGEILKQARKDRKYKAKNVLSETGLSASLSLLSQWENGMKIPTPLDLRVLCKFYGLSESKVFHYWAAAHMPIDSLKSIFVESPTSERLDPNQDPITYPSAITLTIREEDADWFADNPQGCNILVKCLIVSNSGVESASIEALSDQLGIKRIQVKTLCRDLQKKRYLIQDGNHFCTPKGMKYIYIPETEAFERLRRSRIVDNMRRTLDRVSPKMIYDRTAIRQTNFKRLPKEHVKRIVDSIETLSTEMMSHPDSESDEYYQLVCVFGPEGEKHESKRA